MSFMGCTDEYGVLHVEGGMPYAWVVEISEDGQTWWQPTHPAHMYVLTGAIEAADSAEVLARLVLERLLSALTESDFSGEGDLWFRACVWDYLSHVDPINGPFDPEWIDIFEHAYGSYLHAEGVAPDAIEISIPKSAQDSRV